MRRLAIPKGGPSHKRESGAAREFTHTKAETPTEIREPWEPISPYIHIHTYIHTSQFSLFSLLYPLYIPPLSSLLYSSPLCSPLLAVATRSTNGAQARQANTTPPLSWSSTRQPRTPIHHRLLPPLKHNSRCPFLNASSRRPSVS